MRSHSALFSALFLCTALTAQVPISGSIYDGAGGPLLSGTVYHATGSISVPLGQTLTVQAGAIVKFTTVTFTVAGTLLCQGTVGSPCVLTSLHDDSAGGDTNGNGNATALATNQWYGINFQSSSGASALTHTSIRGMGWGSWSVLLDGVGQTFTDCEIRDCGNGGMDLSSAARPVVTRCDFQRIGSQPVVRGLTFDAAANFLDTTASSCPGGAYMRIDAAGVVANTVLGPRNGIGGVLVYAASPNLPAGVALTLQAGLVLKASNVHTFSVRGTLVANGTAANPVVFTSIHDDSAGGDTNQNGNATALAPNQWYGLYFFPTSGASLLTHARIRGMGWGGWSVIVDGSAPGFVDCAITDSGNGGMDLNSTARPVVTRCDFQRIGSQPVVRGLTFDAAAGFLDPTASNCAGGAYMRIEVAAPAADTTLGPRNAIGGVLVYSVNPDVPAGITLTVQAGLVFKANSAHTFSVRGALVANGTAANPVVFTSIHDDSAGGDTNQNGAATALAPNQWYGLYFHPTAGASLLTHARIRGMGWGGWSVIVEGSAPSFVDCAITDGGNGGMDLNSAARPTVTRCDFQRLDGSPAIRCAVYDTLPGLADNTAANCSGGNFLRVGGNSPQASCTVRRENLIGGVLVYAASMSVPAGITLGFDPGVVLKATSQLTISVLGTLVVSGPVVFTSIHDDVYGGDTNGNGSATGPAPNQWYGINLVSGAVAAFDLALLRCTGWGGWAGITSSTGSASLRRCRVELAGAPGFDLQNAFVADDLVAYLGSSHGIVLNGGGFALRRATCAYNAGSGVLRSGVAWSGVVRSSIAFGNGSGFAGFAAGQIAFSNGPGISGGSGNLNVDPLFVAAGAGDLRLAPGSPCIDAGDPLDGPAGLDAIGFPRLLDGNLDGAMRVDMGAFEYDNLILLVSGTPSPGSSLTVTSIATPQLPIVALALGLPFGPGLPVLNFGSLFVDPSGPFDVLFWPVNGSANVPIPNGLVGPIPFAFQLIGLGNPFPLGNLSNPFTFTIE